MSELTRQDYENLGIDPDAWINETLAEKDQLLCAQAKRIAELEAKLVAAEQRETESALPGLDRAFWLMCHPRSWDKSMNAAWHLALPDLPAAFMALRFAAIDRAASLGELEAALAAFDKETKPESHSSNALGGPTPVTDAAPACEQIVYRCVKCAGWCSDAYCSECGRGKEIQQ